MFKLSQFAIFFFGYVLFLCIGASIFMALEAEVEAQRLFNLQNLREDFLRTYPCVKYEDFHKVIYAYEQESRKGAFGSNNLTSWDFHQSLLFVVALVTTIGYGQIAPESESGKIFSILFSLIGIPLTLSVISGIVDRLSVPTKNLLYWLNSKLHRRYKAFQIRLLHLIIVMFVVTIFFIIIPSFIFNYFEADWNLLDSIYYCYMSLTTVGFGDYTPGDSLPFRQSSPMYQITYQLCTIVYLFIGITIMMLALTVFYDIPQLNLGQLYTFEGTEYPVHMQESHIMGSIDLDDSEPDSINVHKRKVTIMENIKEDPE
ncbi:potassium channel subfamily K member 6-like [Anthonomus grandis grandis]|uniref:potassium channel subfamily K member 6-like n=1 Tax=Anthonomus grandis grandis TaxID=2921223 RepID=UPI002166070B|nr:potassium channel subfamily K member 6-like [Anthonomus grandis grandis]